MTKKVVFIAGGTSGINLSIAQRFAAAGAHVAVLSRSADKVDAAVQLLGGDALGYAADVRDYDAVAAALADTSRRWGAIDVLVSGAAGNFLSPAETLSANGFKAVVDIDLLGTFNVLRAAFAHLRKPGASVLTITAPQSWLPTRLQVHVCAAKAGVDQLTRTLALEWGSHGIRVNAIAPGPIADTEGMKRLVPDAHRERALIASIPLARYGTKDEIAEVASLLCSDAAAYITGVILPVDGGWSLSGSGAMTSAIATG
jgi:NAD(P)-dependent dehydrogenase (short-subunit alcohol dehydrogenase family)